MDKISVKSLDNQLVGANYDFSIIYQALTQPPYIADLKTDVHPDRVIDFFKKYTASLARQKLGLSTEQPSLEERSQYSKYQNLAAALETQLLYPHFYPIARKQDGVYTDKKKLGIFKKDFEELGQSLDVICVMTGAFIDSVITSEYLRDLGKDVNLILLYYSTKRHDENGTQIFDSEKEKMRKNVPALVIEDIIQTTTTIERVANYLTKEGYSQLYVFSPRAHKITNKDLGLIGSEIEPEMLRGMPIYSLAQLLRFKPAS